MMCAYVKTSPRILRDERGNVALLFGLMALPLFSSVGAAVDYGNAVSINSKLQAASDAAVLAAASLPADASADERTSVAANLFATNATAHGVTGATPEIRVEGSSISVSVSANVPTAFLQLMHINTIAVAVSAQSTYTVDSSAKACLLALDPESGNGIHIQGAGRVNYPGCWAHTNSSQATAINAAGVTLRQLVPDIVRSVGLMRPMVISRRRRFLDAKLLATRSQQ